jgi:hypothetical protein
MKTIKYLIEEIVDLKVDLISLENKNTNLNNEWKAAKDIICNLKQEITNLRITLQEKNK